MFARTLIVVVAAVVLAVPAAALQDETGKAMQVVQSGPVPGVFLFVEARDYGPGASKIEEHLSAEPDDAAAWRQLGYVRLLAGRWDDAIEAMEKAAELAPGDIGMQLALSDAYREKARRSGGLGAMKTAKKWKSTLERCVEMDPNNVDARVWLSRYLLHAPGIGGGDKDRGLELARATIPIDDFEGRLATAYAYRRRGEYDKAFAQYDTLYEEYPDGSNVYRGYGYAYLEIGEPAKAQVWFERIIRLTPWDTEAHTGRGDALREQGKLDEAIESYRRALEIDPYFSEARFALAGILYEEKKDYRAAYDEFRFISEKNPQFYEAGEAKKLAHRIKKKHL